MRRTYNLTKEPVTTNYGAVRREILKFTDEGEGEVLIVESILVVANEDAMDVLEAIRRAYQDGREDRAGEDAPLEQDRSRECLECGQQIEVRADGKFTMHALPGFPVECQGSHEAAYR